MPSTSQKHSTNSTTFSNFSNAGYPVNNSIFLSNSFKEDGQNLHNSDGNLNMSSGNLHIGPGSLNFGPINLHNGQNLLNSLKFQNSSTPPSNNGTFHQQNEVKPAANGLLERQRVRFNSLEVYSFAKKQSFDTVPESGGIPLGMEAKHEEKREMTINQYERNAKRENVSYNFLFKNKKVF